MSVIAVVILPAAILAAGLWALLGYGGGTSRPVPEASQITRPPAHNGGGPVQTPATPISVPNTIGLSQAQACAALEDVDLSCSAQIVPSSSVGAGHVLSQAPVIGSAVAPQSTVVVEISSGP